MAISIHAPRAGRDLTDFFINVKVLNFNPRAPCGARQAAVIEANRQRVFQSTRPVRGATD